MKHILLIIGSLLLPLSLFSQGEDISFSDAIKINFKKYKKESLPIEKAIQKEENSCLIPS